MKIEKAIERMKSYKQMHSDDYFDMAISALEKQMPKEPIDSTGKDAIVQEGECPGCGQCVDDVQSYCHECGQALKWQE